MSSKTGAELFLVDNSDADWKVLRYLHDWCQLSKGIDIATGYFEIGALLALKGEWQKVDHNRLGRPAEFTRYFSVLVKEQSVPENIPFAMPWEKIKAPVPASAKRIRGKLNVPRERFRVTEEGEFTWAGET